MSGTLNAADTDEARPEGSVAGQNFYVERIPVREPFMNNWSTNSPTIRVAKPQQHAMNPAARVCFAVAACAFLAAAVGLLANQALAGAMEVMGMAAVGLFYTGMGVLKLERQPPAALPPT